MMKTSLSYSSCLSICVLVLTATNVHSRGRPGGVGNNVGEYGPQNIPSKSYSFNYEVTDEHGNTHYRREQGDPSGIVTGTYGYMNLNGLFRSVEYVANAEGYKAKVRTNEPGTKGTGSADVDLQVDPVPPGLQEMFQKKTPVSEVSSMRRNQSGMKG